MKLAQVQFAPWDKAYNFSLNDLDVKIGDKVVVKTELGVEMGEVAGFTDFKEAKLPAGSLASSEEECACSRKDKCPHREIKPILRKATLLDYEKAASDAEKKKAIAYCKKQVRQHDIPMKLVDAHFSFDGSRLTFAFIADGRIDFRELAKDLTRHFNRTIRLHQIGIRDEARVAGDYGPCGRPLCCAKFLHGLSSITSEMAELQQCAHRGSDRLSGVCGRLKCCLAYEIEGYSELAAGMPPIGAKVNVDGKKGVVVSHHTLKQSVNVEFPGEKEGERGVVIEVDLRRNRQ